MEEHEERIKDMEARFQQIIDEIDRSHLRKMQGDMYRCAANCCDNPTYSMEKKQICTQNCSVPLQNAQNYVQTEIDRLQNRWSRCIMECNDKARDAAMPGESTTGLAKKFGACAAVCIDAQCNLLQIARRSMDRVLASGKFDEAQM